MFGRRLAIAATGSVAVLLTASCANTGSGGNEADAAASDESGPLTVGAILPLSGPSGPNGETVLQGIETCAQIVNEDGGVDGREIEVLSRDDESTPAVGVTAANELAREGVDVVMGGWNSPVTLAIQPVLAREEVLNITSIPQSSEILGGADPNALRLNAGNQVGGYVAAKHLGEEVGAERIAVMYENDAYGLDGVKQFRESLSEIAPDAEVVADEKFAFTDTDFRVALSGVKQSNPDAVFTLNAAAVTGQPTMMKQANQAQVDATMFAATGTLPPSVAELAGDAASEGWRSAEIYFPDQEPFSGYEINNRFVDLYSEASGGSKPDKYAALGCQSVLVWAHGISESGSTAASDVSDAIKGSTISDTVMGEVEFTDEGQMISDVYTFEVENGEFAPLGEVEVPTEIWQN
jgi:branched-chain amino acid transport system substrate-binding protein